VLKPNVILFGEQLPIQVLRRAQEAAKQADVMLVIGSSLEVAPASEIPLLARRNGAKIIIVNLDCTPLDSDADIVLRDDAAHLVPELVRGLEQAD
jgi:NAD-dependent deacetylase